MTERYVFKAISPDTFRIVEFEIKVPPGLNSTEVPRQAPAQIAERKSDGLKAGFRSIFAPWRIVNFLRLHSSFSGIMFVVVGLAAVVIFLSMFSLPFFAFFRIAEGGNSEVAKNINLCHQSISSQLYESAIEYCDEVLKVTPNNGNALNDKGAALYGLRKYAEATEYFIKALVVMPDDPVILTNQCDVLQKLGKQQAAIRYCDKALSIDPSNASAQALKNTSLAALNSSGLQVSPSGGSEWTLDKEKFMSACLGNRLTREECIKAFCRYLMDPSLEPECNKLSQPIEESKKSDKVEDGAKEETKQKKPKSKINVKEVEKVLEGFEETIEMVAKVIREAKENWRDDLKKGGEEILEDIERSLKEDVEEAIKELSKAEQKKMEKKIEELRRKISVLRNRKELESVKAATSQTADAEIAAIKATVDIVKIQHGLGPGCIASGGQRVISVTDGPLRTGYRCDSYIQATPEINKK